MSDLLSLYSSILKINETSDADGSLVVSLPKLPQHKLGLSPARMPVFFIKCFSSIGDAAIPAYDLNYLSVRFNQVCDLMIDGKQASRGNYTVATLKIASPEITNYFLDIFYLMLTNLRHDFTQTELGEEIRNIVQLFANLSTPSNKTVQGLFAELIVMDKSSNPEYLVSSWHKSPTDKFDFNDGIDKIEVKSTILNRRIHRFSLDQLQPNRSSRLLIASVITIETSFGKNVFDLVDAVSRRVGNDKTEFQFKEKLASILGSDFEKAGEVYFDYKRAFDSLAFYGLKNIRSIALTAVPPQLNNVKFDCDLTGIPEAKRDKTSELFKSL